MTRTGRTAGAAPARRRTGRALALTGLVSCTPLVSAQVQTIQAGLNTVLTATDNGAGAPRGQEQRDLVLNLQPTLRVDRRSAGLTLVGEAGASVITSANKTRPDRTLPQARLSADATLVERLLQLQAAFSVQQTEQDPFAARVEPGATRNALTASTLQLTPIVQRELSPLVTFTARDNETWTRYSGDLADDTHSRQTLVRLERKPKPFGASIEARDEALSFRRGEAGNWQSRSLIGSASYSFADDWAIGLLGGAERSSFELVDSTDSRRGIRLFWSPGPRTELVGSAERRYFGNGGDLRIRHRTPFLAGVVRVVREPSAGGNLPGAAAAGARLEDFLDAILTTRFPDPAQRAAEVAGVMTSRALQGQIQGVAGVASNYPQLRTGGEATVVALSSRHLLSLSFYAQSLRQLTRTDGRPLTNFVADAETRQYGAALGFNRRLSPVTSLDADARWFRISGVGLRAGDQTREALYKLTVARNLSPRTGVSLGVQHRAVRGNTAATGDFDETTAFAGLAHRF